MGGCFSDKRHGCHLRSSSTRGDVRCSSARSCCSACIHLRGTCASRHLCRTGSCCHLCGTIRVVHRSCACGDVCGTSTSDLRGTGARGDVQVSSCCQCQSGVHQVDRSI